MLHITMRTFYSRFSAMIYLIPSNKTKRIFCCQRWPGMDHIVRETEMHATSLKDIPGKSHDASMCEFPLLKWALRRRRPIYSTSVEYLPRTIKQTCSKCFATTCPAVELRCPHIEHNRWWSREISSTPVKVSTLQLQKYIICIFP